MIYIEKVKPEIERICRRLPIKRLGLFGSALTRNFSQNSEIDVLVSFKDAAGWGLFDFVDTVDELKTIFGRKVDLVEKDSLRNAFRRQSILAGNEVIYAA